MAEIHIERKRSIWPWVLGLLALLLVAWFILGMRDSGTDELARDADAGAVAATAAAPGAAANADDPAMGESTLAEPVEGFLAYVRDAESRPEMGLDHAYTSTGLGKLADAIEAVASRDTANGATLAPQLAEIRDDARRLGAEPESLRHADLARRAFTNVGALLTAMQEQRFPSLGEPVAAVRDAAEDVQPGRELLDQKDAVHRFFARSADAVRAMATNA